MAIEVAMQPDPVTVLRGHAGEVQALEIDTSERWLVSGDSQGEVRVWDLQDRRPVAIRRLHPVNAGVINLRLFRAPSGGQLLATQGRDGVTHLWACPGDAAPIPSEEPVCTIAREAYHFCRFSMLAPDSSGSCSGGGGGGSCPSPVHTCAGGSGEPAPGAAPLLLAVPGDDAAVAEVWCCACRRRVAEFRGEAAGRKLGMVMSLALYQTAAEAGAAAAAAEGGASGGGNDNNASGRIVSSGGGSARGGIFLAAGYEEGSLVVWDLAAPAGAAPAAQRRLHTEPMMALALDPGGASGVCGAAEGKLVCFRVDHGAGVVRVTQSIELRKQGISDVAVRPDGRLLVSAGWDGRVRVYKRSSGRALAVLKYHKASATVVRFSERSMFLASGSRDGTIALWDIYQPALGSPQQQQRIGQGGEIVGDAADKASEM